MDLYQLLNLLINNKGINIKKLYSIDKEILEGDKITIKNVYCKNRTNKNQLCLNKCINDSKYCSIHDPIMRELKINNRKNMNMWRRESSKFLNLEYDVNTYSKKIFVENNTLSYEPDYKEIIINPSAPLLEDIIENPPQYIQKPDECGKNIINYINNNNTNIELQPTETNKTNYKSINKTNNIKQLYKPSNKDEINYRFNYFRDNLLVNNNIVDYIQDYQFTDINGPMDNYLNNLNNTNIKELQLKGVRSHKIINELIAINISSYYKAYNRIPSTNFFYKYANTISNIISKIPK